MPCLQVDYFRRLQLSSVIATLALLACLVPERAHAQREIPAPVRAATPLTIDQIRQYLAPLGLAPPSGVRPATLSPEDGLAALGGRANLRFIDPWGVGPGGALLFSKSVVYIGLKAAAAGENYLINCTLGTQSLGEGSYKVNFSGTVKNFDGSAQSVWWVYEAPNTWMETFAITATKQVWSLSSCDVSTVQKR